MKQELIIDESGNLVEQLRGRPERPEQTTTRTIERINWLLVDRIARLLTTIVVEGKLGCSPDLERDAYDVMVARVELHDALFDLRCYGSKDQQPEQMRPPKVRLLGGYNEVQFGEKDQAKCHQTVDCLLHRLPTKGGEEDATE